MAAVCVMKDIKAEKVADPNKPGAKVRERVCVYVSVCVCMFVCVCVCLCVFVFVCVMKDIKILTQILSHLGWRWEWDENFIENAEKLKNEHVQCFVYVFLNPNVYYFKTPAFSFHP